MGGQVKHTMREERLQVGKSIASEAILSLSVSFPNNVKEICLFTING